jgi:hypothetical protein
MPQPVADPANVFPRQAGTQRGTLFAEPYSRFADQQKLPLHGRHGFEIFTVGFEVHPERELLDHGNRLGDVASERLGSLKGKHGLTRCLRPHRLLQHMRRGEVHMNPKQVGKPVLKPDHIQQ